MFLFFAAFFNTIASSKVDIVEKPPLVIIGGVQTLLTTDTSQILIFATMTDLIVSEGVEVIGASAFKSANQLKNVTLPESLITISSGGFHSCKNLQFVKFGNNIQTIGYASFENTILTMEFVTPEALTLFDEYSMPESRFTKIIFRNKNPCTVSHQTFRRLPNIDVVFGNCEVILKSKAFFQSTISKITIGPRVIIENNPFFLDNLLTITVDLSSTLYKNDNFGVIEISTKKVICYPSKRTGSYTIPADVDTIRSQAFCRTSLSSLNCDSIKTIENNAFEQSRGFLTEIQLPSIISIGSNAFLNSLLTRITLGGSVAKIDNGAFTSCVNLIYINLPSSLTNDDSLGTGILAGCSSLQNVDVPNDHPLICKDSQNILYTKYFKSFIFIPSQILYIDIPANATLSDGGFRNLYNLTGVRFNANYNNFPDYLFNSCKAIETFKVPATVTRVGYYVFSGCIKLRTVEFLGTSVHVGQHGFAYNPSLEEIIWPNTIYLDPWAFRNADAMKTLVLPSDTRTVSSAFLTCAELETVELRCLNAQLVNAFEGCPKLNKIIIDMTAVVDFAFMQLKSLKTIVFGQNVEKIGLSSFFSSPKLTTIEWENIAESKLTTIGNNAFSKCDSLAKIDIPQKVEGITASIFSESKLLTWIEVDSRSVLFKSINGIVYNIGETVLVVCPAGLETITTLDSTEALGKYAFAGCYLKEIVLTPKLTEINEFCFLNCMNLKQVNIPLNISYIGETPFKGCSSLKYIFYCGKSDYGMNTFGDKDPFPENIIIWVTNLYVNNSFMNHQVHKSSSIDPNECPNVPTNNFTNTKKNRIQSKLLQLLYLVLFIGSFKPKY